MRSKGDLFSSSPYFLKKKFFSYALYWAAIKSVFMGKNGIKNSSILLFSKIQTLKHLLANLNR